MRISITQKLRSINYKFYIHHANDFAKTRNYIQPGIRKSFQIIPTYQNLLDVGCGNGRVLTLTNTINNNCKYTGIDFSSIMIANAPKTPNAKFMCLDITSTNWTSVFSQPFDTVVCFSVLHHIPGHNNRMQIIKDIYSILKPGGFCAISVWQFLQTPRLRKKIVPWETVGIAPDYVDENDYLIDWKGGHYGIRYVHHFTKYSLTSMCQHIGFHVQHIFDSDGKNGSLGLYTILHKPT